MCLQVVLNKNDAYICIYGECVPTCVCVVCFESACVQYVLSVFQD